ncbi:Mrp/NBP35 family ATP-binding protein [Canibacter zhoujuaniae]|uniref:Mrp/NBP35 family ATP-binding protein n=1 Tax=Canibacter zhoujuaniae TaxID=2708343 RepID=UPI001FB99390|nr:Mrp/NBP35 family ATP-binding protein [Canibacter zhoujuaniae]
MSLEKAIYRALETVIDPEIRRPLTELDMVREVTVTDSFATVKIDLTILGCPAANRIENEVCQALDTVAGLTGYELKMGVMDPAQRKALIEKLRGGKRDQFGPDSLTRVIAVTSGKGGVGKSTVTANLAVALAQMGRSVGVVDADVFGFSIPRLLGLHEEKPENRPTKVGDMIMPPAAHGVRAISIGMFLGPENAGRAVSWRGPMLHRTIEQFLRDVWFGDLDYLLLDLPPGTGDIAISVSQLLPRAEVLVVTTPQLQAAEVAMRSGELAKNAGQKLLGIIETMSGYTGADGSVVEIFGSGGGQTVANSLSVPLLGKLPLSPAFGSAGERGIPAVLAAQTDPASQALVQIAQDIDARGRNLAGKKLPLGVL